MQIPKLKRRLAVRSPNDVRKLAKAIWVPSALEWNAVLEDFLTIARRRTDHKLALLRVQTEIVTDLILRSKEIQQIDQQLKAGEILTEGSKPLKIDDEPPRW